MDYSQDPYAFKVFIIMIGFAMYFAGRWLFLSIEKRSGAAALIFYVVAVSCLVGVLNWKGLAV